MTENITFEELVEKICKLAKESGYGNITSITFERVKKSNISKIVVNLPITFQ